MLGRTLPNLFRPSSIKRRCYVEQFTAQFFTESVFEPEPFRSKNTKVRWKKNTKEGVVRIASAYRTVLTVALQVISGVAPLICLQEKGNIYVRKHRYECKSKVGWCRENKYKRLVKRMGQERKQKTMDEANDYYHLVLVLSGRFLYILNEKNRERGHR